MSQRHWNLFTDFIYFYYSGLTAGQSHHSGPGHSDWAVSANHLPHRAGLVLPVLPQCPVSTQLPLQGPTCAAQGTSGQRLLPPASLHRKCHEVQRSLFMGRTDFRHHDPMYINSYKNLGYMILVLFISNINNFYKCMDVIFLLGHYSVLYIWRCREYVV